MASGAGGSAKSDCNPAPSTDIVSLSTRIPRFFSLFGF